MMERQLGKIKYVRIGYGGYQDAMFGIDFTLGGESWGVGDFWGMWASDPGSNAQWTKEDQIKRYGETMDRIRKLCDDANVKVVDKLKDVPIEVELENMTLKSWRVLREVI